MVIAFANSICSLVSFTSVVPQKKGSAAEALERVKEAPEEAGLILVLSDINMPAMTGLELLPKVKALRPSVPVIMITAYGDADTKRRALEAGAQGLLTKPIDFTVLRSEIDTRIEQRGAGA